LLYVPDTAPRGGSFSGKTGFKACYDEQYYPVTFPGLSNSRRTTRLPDVTKLLLQKYYFADGKEPGIAIA
jgi:hypothetical protein